MQDLLACGLMVREEEIDDFKQISRTSLHNTINLARMILAGLSALDLRDQVARSSPGVDSCFAMSASISLQSVKQIDLEVLTNDPLLARLCQNYWAVDEEGRFEHSVKALAAQHEIQVSRVSKLVTQNSVARNSDSTCQLCGEGRILTSRQDLTSLTLHGETTSFICVECRALLAREDQERRQQQLVQRAAILQETYQVREGARLRPTDLRLQDTIILLALLRSSEHLPEEGTVPISRRDDPFAPTKDFGIELISDVLESGLIDVHPDSPLDAFVWTDEEPNHFYLADVSYYLQGDGPVEIRSAAFEQEAVAVLRDADWPDEWIQQWKPFWLELGIQNASRTFNSA